MIAGMIALLTVTGFGQNADGSSVNTIVTAVPFLRIVPDARFGAMGDVGIAMSPDPNSLHFNASALAFAEHDFSISATYTPWLRALGINDIFLSYLSAYKKIDKNSALGFGLRYFSLGKIDFTDINATPTGSARPNEFELNAAYSRRLGKEFSIALSMKFIFSSLAPGQISNGVQIRPGTAVASDISFTWRKPIKTNGRNSLLTVGAAVSNLGTKISYQQNGNRDYIPTNLGIGASFDYAIDDHNSLTFGVDINKLLVPTPIAREILDENGNVIDNPEYDNENGDGTGDGIADYRQKSVPAAVFGSFGDAPGGFAEEMSEFMIGAGAEYWYDKQFAFRMGYYWEHPDKGARKFLSLGLGVKYSVFALNFSYIVPTTSIRLPMDNTLRFSLMFNLGKADKTPIPTELN